MILLLVVKYLGNLLMFNIMHKINNCVQNVKII